jgi:hypothetical protein
MAQDKPFVRQDKPALQGEGEKRRPEASGTTARAQSTRSREYFGGAGCLDKWTRSEALEVMATRLRGVRWETSLRTISMVTAWTAADS